MLRDVPLETLEGSAVGTSRKSASLVASSICCALGILICRWSRVQRSGAHRCAETSSVDNPLEKWMAS